MYYSPGRIALTVYAIGLLAFFALVFKDERELGAASLILLGTLKDLRF